MLQLRARRARMAAMPSLFQTTRQKGLLGLAFIVFNTLVTVIAVGHQEAARLGRHNEEKALAFSHSLASLMSEKVGSYVTMLELASRTYANSRDDKRAILENLYRVAPVFGGFVSLMRDRGSYIEVLRPTRVSRNLWMQNVDPRDARFAPLVTMLRAARNTGQPRVSGVYFSPLAGQHMVAISTGALNDEATPEQFAIHVPSQVFSNLLSQQGLDAGFFAALSDSSGRVVARSGEQNRQFAGRRAPDWFLRARAGREDGIARGEPLSGSALPEYDFVFHRLTQPQGWYVTVAYAPGLLRPRFVIGTETIAWATLVFLASLLIGWAAYGRELRAERMRRKVDEATRKLLRGLPGALVQIALPEQARPQLVVSHGVLAPSLADWPPDELAGALREAARGREAGAPPLDLRRGGRTFRIFATGESKPEGGPRMLDAYVLDVTELKEAEAVAASTARLAAVGKIYASIAHEISQPLNIISLAAENGSESLREGDKPSASRKFESIVKQARQARQIVDRLLVFARGNPAPEQLIRVDLDSCLANARQLVEPKLRQGGVRLQVHTSSPGLKVLATPAELEHVFMNLLLNAIYAVTENAGESQRRIDVRIAARGPDATIDIEDTGGGIDDKVMDRLFEPFMTTKPLGAGTGLGLAFVQGAMKSFGGRADILNGAKGALVRLTLRLAPGNG